MRNILVALVILLFTASSAQALPPQCADAQKWQALMVAGTQIRGAKLVTIDQYYTTITLDGQVCGPQKEYKITSWCVSSEWGMWQYNAGNAPNGYFKFNSPVGIPIQVAANVMCLPNLTIE